MQSGTETLPGPPVPDLTRRAIVAVLLLLVSVLMLQAWLAVELGGRGIAHWHAVNLARLVTLPLLFGLVWSLLGRCSGYLRQMFSPAALTPAIIAGAILIGVTARVMAWAELTARGALGIVPGASLAPPRPFTVAFDCEEPVVMAVAALAWLVLVPVTEEFVHRGVLQAWLQRYGTWQAITLSSVVFTLMHESSNHPWVFLMGVLLGVQFRLSCSLWPPIITHASYDGLHLLDALCVRLAWNPAVDTLPRWGLAATSVVLFAVGAAVIACILWRYPDRQSAE